MSAMLHQTAKHWFAQTELGKGIRLDAAQLDLLNSLGVGKVIADALADQDRAHQRPTIQRGCEHCDPFIYFIQAGPTGPIKIGYAKDAKQRCRALQIACHTELRLIIAMRAPQSAEGALHAFFKRERVRGEWFRPSPRLLGFIAELRP
jgi:hypothetical protein